MSILSSTFRTALVLGPLASLLALAQPAPDIKEPHPKDEKIEQPVPKKDGGSASLLATGKPDQKTDKLDVAEEKGELLFDADTLEMDFGKRMGTFEGNVKVTDGRMLLLADKMVVYLAEKNEPRLIEAIGNVVISEIGQQRKATAGKGVFDVEKDEIVLTEDPTLEDAEWGVRESEKMVYNRTKATFKLYKVRGGGTIDDKGRGPRDLFGPAKQNEKKDKEEPKS